MCNPFQVMNRFVHKYDDQKFSSYILVESGEVGQLGRYIYVIILLKRFLRIYQRFYHAQSLQLRRIRRKCDF